MSAARIVFAAFMALSVMDIQLARSEDLPKCKRTEDVVYGRKYGTALTLDIFTPEKTNGAGVVFAVSGGWFSAHEMINLAVYAEFVRRGYTVFAVTHACQPKFTIPEILEDMNRSVRFIRYHAKDYGVDPNRLAIAGCSAGGHLSLMIGTAGDKGNPEAKDPINRESSRVQAVGCYSPPTDFLNYGQEVLDVFKALEDELKQFKPPFDFTEIDPETHQFVLITDMEKRRRIAREISPVTHATTDDPPTLILHGDADKLVPIQQAQVMIKALEAKGVPAKLVVKTGEGHGWADWMKDMAILGDWFDTYLKAGN